MSAGRLSPPAERSLFDPPRATASSVAAARPQPRALSVRALVARIQLALQEGFPSRPWVEGELSNFRVGRGGHAFCCLKDADAQVEAIVWSSTLATLKFTPKDGMHVLAQVRKVDFYAPNGRLRVQLERLEPQGVGALYRALEERRRLLAAEGLFEEGRKRPLPLLPRTVGIATAPSGAVVHDMLRTLGQRFAERRILIRPCKVQGEGAAADIAAALDDLNRDPTVDVILVGRGGGSIEDLWAFNEEIVVRAIARSRAPVVSAVGHEVDWTLADLVADARAATPTAAAQRALPERAALEDDLAEHARRLREGLLRRVELARARLHAREAQLGDPRERMARLRLRADGLIGRAQKALLARFHRSETQLRSLAARVNQRAPDARARRSEIERLTGRMRRAIDRPLAKARNDFGRATARLDALSPLAVLARGFALARLADGTIVRDAAALGVGDEVEVEFARGSARASVLEVSRGPDRTLPTGRRS